MKFHTVLLVITFMGLICVALKDYSFYSFRLDKKTINSRQAFTAKKFIAESFRNTCEGKGFENLEQWQLCCRAIFKLEYIGWCQAQDFMIDDFAGGGELMYGKWVASGDIKECSDEVYCRKHRSDF